MYHIYANLSIDMFGSKKRRNSINLLNNIDLPKDSSELFYFWLVNYGRYILIGVEILVIIVFISKILVDQQYNYAVLDSSNLQNKLKSSNIRYDVSKITSYQSKIGEIAIISKASFNYEYVLNKILKLVPNGITIQSINLAQNKLTLTVNSNTYAQSQQLENNFRSDTKNFNSVYIPSLSNSSNINNSNISPVLFSC